MSRNKAQNDSMLADLGSSTLGTMGDQIENSLRKSSERKKKLKAELADIAEVADVGIEEVLRRRGSSAKLDWSY